MVSDEEIDRILNATQGCNPHLGYANDDLLKEDLLIPGEDGMPQCINFELRGKGYGRIKPEDDPLASEAALSDAEYIKQAYGISLQ